ncbi:hypothetical protein [Thalassorhabdomicrobium marinisediminis]|uniref:Histidine kinase n=1 Tax=Thalassorhabdomicrobium marinisediminis TaxID=2170577 RepID=A0A2T7FUN8_9RHOB|nr:hypothetical protein [Thalassorhabdomicrobium marinisediminis]PVA05877.1 hypothetical protein DC363_13765 [Thalassorhabdomicrobium marinisediminis]
MQFSGKVEFGKLQNALDKMHFAITISNLSAPDQPLVYFNPAFQTLTGATAEHLGQNCRFLQGDTENDAARAEIRTALTEKRPTLVVLKNVHQQSGELFHNLLMLEHVGVYENAPELAVGTQFGLLPEELNDMDLPDGQVRHSVVAQVADTILRTRLQRRRIASDTAVRLLQSWSIMAAQPGPA